MTASVRRLAVVASLGLVAAAVVAAPAVASPAAFDVRPAPGHKVHYPTVQSAGHARGARRPAATVNGTGPLAYGGGVSGIGVTTGAPLVYLVFWGTQWGAPGTDRNGDTTFSGDTRKIAPVLQQMFKGIGTSGETWSGVMTQYCDGASIGATSCAPSAVHVGYPTGGALAGVLYDSSAAAPSTSSDTDIARVALAAAASVGRTSTAQNRNVQYVVVSPPGTHPGGFNTPSANWCAWHDWTGDTTLVGTPISSSYHAAFTNLPYIPDMGLSCGANYVNLATGSLDGVTIVEGHEYAETITDQFPAGGWTDTSGYENADKCAWVGTGGTGGAQNVSFGAAGTFPMQGTYSNDSASCRIAHPIVSGVTNTVTVTNPGPQTALAGTAITPLQLQATGAVGAVTWSATGLPTGLAISTSGLVTGTPSTSGSFTVVASATDTGGASGSATFTWSVTGSGNLVTIAPIANQSTVQTHTGSVQAVGGDSVPATLTYSAAGLPPGITMNASTGVMSGTATSRGSSTVTVTVTDGTGPSASTTFTWTVTATAVTITAISGDLVSVPRRTTVTGPTMSGTTTDQASSTLTWSATGLPSGVSLSSAGKFGGRTSRTVATYHVTATATDGTGSKATYTFQWKVT